MVGAELQPPPFIYLYFYLKNALRVIYIQQSEQILNESDGFLHMSARV